MQDDLIGKAVAGRYRVLEKMGEGGMGTVYRAEHIAIGKQLALKVLLTHYARKPDLKERFLREAKAAAAIGHENIVDITDFGDTPDGSVFFAMEYLDGRDLSHAIKEGGPLSWQRAKPIMLQICRALGAAHAKQIVHRDMKPENVFLIEREGRPDFVKVLDFGIAKVSTATDGDHRLTRTGMIFGTPEYMSPEQAQGHSPDHRVDVYAVGVIMYEMLTGHVPFKADTFMGILTKHIFEEPVPPSKVNPDVSIPPDVEAIVLKAMVKDRNERFQSMTEMAATLAQTASRRVRGTGEQPKGAIYRLGEDTGSLSSPRALQPSGSDAAARAPKRRSKITDLVPTHRGRVIAWTMGFVLLAAAAITAAMVMRPAQTDAEDTTATSGPRADAAAADEVVSIRLESEPSRARVLKGNLRIGVTPTRLTLPRSDESVMLTFEYDGYHEMREAVVPDRDGMVLRVTLVKKVEPPPPPPAPPEKVEPPEAAPVTKKPPPRRRKPRSPADKARGKGGRGSERPKPPGRVEDLIDPFD